MSLPSGAGSKGPWGEQPALSDGVVDIAPFDVRHVSTIVGWDCDPEVQRWFDWSQTRAAGFDYEANARSTVEKKWAAWASGEEMVFVIADHRNGEGAGWCAMHPKGQGRGEISYGLLPGYRGRGFASRGVMLLSGFAFEVLGFRRLELRVDANNAQSRALAVRCRFVEEGIMRSYGEYERYEPLLGQRFDMVLYARLNDGRSRPS
ncbi:MAG TPA: GNAT family N-acetyltransferase [Tepidiformaceae bacterium]